MKMLRLLAIAATSVMISSSVTVFAQPKPDSPSNQTYEEKWTDKCGKRGLEPSDAVLECQGTPCKFGQENRGKDHTEQGNPHCEPSRSTI